MKKSMCITYEVGDGLYINMTNRCSNRCDFCIRNNNDGAYGSDSLWLEHEPSVNEVLSSVFSRDLAKYSEIVFCGYGEPTYRLDDLLSVARAIKKTSPNLSVRINTNGQSSLINGRDTAPDFTGCIDSISISLNASSSIRYQEICHSVYGANSFDEILKFAKNVKNYVQNTAFSVVKDFLSDEEIERCREISAECGVPLRVRDYISE